MPEQREQIPPSLTIALDVTEQDYRRARRQNRILWLGTIGATLIAAGFWLEGPMVRGFVQWTFGTGIVTHIVLRLFLREASRMETMKYRKYKELREWREVQAKRAGAGADEVDSRSNKG